MTLLMIAGKRNSKAVERKEWENIVYQLEPTYFLGDF